MPHYRQEQLFEEFFIENKVSSFTHVYKGKDFIISKETMDQLPKEVIQSAATRLSKQKDNESQSQSGSCSDPKPGESGNNNSQQSGKGTKSSNTDFDSEDSDQDLTENEVDKIKDPIFENVEDYTKTGKGTDNKVVKKITDAELIRKEILRIALTEEICEGRLHYPRVFKRLLTEPYRALQEKRKIIDTKLELYIYVDSSVGYNHKDNGFHNTLFLEASKIKGVKAFNTTRLYVKNSGNLYYMDHLLKNVKPGKTVLVFSQGCGGVPDNINQNVYSSILKAYNIHYITHFEGNSTCGCNTIPYHSVLKQKGGVKSIIKGVKTAKDLSKIPRLF